MVLTRAIRRIPSTPESRVRLLLDFARRDFATLSSSTKQAAWDLLFLLQSQQSVRVPVRDDPLAETHRALAGCIQALANGQPYDVFVPGLTWRLRPPPRRPTGARHSAPATRESAEAKFTGFAMPAMAVLAFFDALNAIDADRLRSCPFETDGRRCGVIFLGIRNQKFCSHTHAQAAASRAFEARDGDVRRKLQRK